jgi:hypothetical protein
MVAQIGSVIAVAIVVGLIGAISAATGQPWLVPSLGAAAFIQALTPHQPSARTWSMVVGQLAGVGGGFAGVYAAGVAASPAFTDGHPLLWLRVLAVVVAMLVTAALQRVVKAINPAGGATALLLSIGNEPARATRQRFW